MIDSEKKVKIALLSYQVSSGKDCNAGWNIIRYAQKGLISVSPESGWMFMEAYPQAAEYTILKLAKMGKLAYKPDPKELLEKIQKES